MADQTTHPSRGKVSHDGLRRRAQAPAQVALLVFAVAWVVRLIPLWARGGYASFGRYDDGVYYAGATAYILGKTPYDQFVYLHPPGSILLLAPFVGIGQAFGDATGFRTAQVFITLLGAVTAAVIATLAYRHGRRAALSAGLLYAVLSSAVYTESSVMLEGLSAPLIAVALLVSRRSTLPRDGLAVGALLGVAMTIKLWSVLILLALIPFEYRLGGWRRAASTFIGGVIASTAICLPFFLQAPGPMFRYVVLDQLGRPRQPFEPAERLLAVMGISVSFPAPGTSNPTLPLLWTAMALAVFPWIAVACIRRSEYAWAALLGVTIIFLLVSPSFFLQYASFAAIPLALAGGLAFSQVERWRSILALVVVGTQIYFAIGRPQDAPLDNEPLAFLKAQQGCISTDDPTILIQTNTLSHNVNAGCRVWIDVTGLTYDEAGGRPKSGDPWVSRIDRELWQSQVLSYLTSAPTAAVMRHSTRLSSRSLEQLAAGRFTYCYDDLTLYTIQPDRSGHPCRR